MKCNILHECRGRMRVHLCLPRMTLCQADHLAKTLSAVPEIDRVEVFDRTRDVILYYTDREAAVRALARFSFAGMTQKEPAPSSRALTRDFEEKLTFSLLSRAASKIFLPAPLRAGLAVFRSFRYLRAGARSLLSGRLSVSVLDATAVTVSLCRGDFNTAGSVMFMLRIGELLEEFTRKKSVADLADAMSLRVDKVWLQKDGCEVLVPLSKVLPGDLLVVRTGGVIPLDGRVTQGTATVNQSSMTGEALPIAKSAGSPVYAGTVVEEGECVFRVEKTAGDGRYDRIVRMIAESEKMKSTAEDKAARLADRLVPYTFLGTALTYLLTRNPTKALSVLMVDFSCALKLSIPIAVISAMRECQANEISVKGGRFLEAVALADTVVFDKTGTLTRATPCVSEIVTFGGEKEEEMLRLAACLEEHYPHSLANAVVEEARRRGLSHQEYHSGVAYVVAHGISSTVNRKKVVIGSYHYVFEDEKCRVPKGEQARLSALPEDCTHLYLAISGRLAAVICIRDPLREEAREALAALRACGIRKMVMMTGDSERTAACVARAVGVDEYHAEVLPEDKAAFIRAEQAAGRRVLMVGDGVNDTLALSGADAGIAIQSGAAIAREVADITVSSSDLFKLVRLRQIAMALGKRMHANYRKILGINLALIVLGVSGLIAPTTSAFLHNFSTLLISLRSMTNLLPAEK